VKYLLLCSLLPLLASGKSQPHSPNQLPMCDGTALLTALTGCDNCNVLTSTFFITDPVCGGSCAWSAFVEVGCTSEGQYGTYSVNDAGVITCGSGNGHVIRLPCIGQPGKLEAAVIFECKPVSCPP
jgi:hypothetical protein